MNSEELNGRENDPTIVICHRCSWCGKVMECIHDYKGNGNGGDVVPVDFCPCCGSEELEPEPSFELVKSWQ